MVSWKREISHESVCEKSARCCRMPSSFAVRSVACCESVAAFFSLPGVPRSFCDCDCRLLRLAFAFSIAAVSLAARGALSSAYARIRHGEGAARGAAPAWRAL